MKKLPLFKVHMPDGVHKALNKVIYSGFIGQGKYVDKFEKKLSSYFNNPNLLTVNAATSAIHLALRLCDVKNNDEVICTPMTCTATNMPVLIQGGKIVWADVDPESGLVTANSIQKKISSNTKAIIIVHFGGIPCDVLEINKLAKKFNIKVIEDAAHALGSQIGNKKIGNHSDFIIFSLQAIKHITTGDGGILICKRRHDYKRAKLLRWFGIDRDQKRKDFRCEEDIKEYGYKYHMNDISASIGLEQMKYINKIVKKNQINGEFFNKNLKNIKGIKLIKKNENHKISYWIYTLHIEKFRNEFVKYMQKKNIAVSRVHERNDIHTAFKDFRANLPGLEKFNSTQISIPVGWWLSRNDLKRIKKEILNFSKIYFS